MLILSSFVGEEIWIGSPPDVIRVVVVEIGPDRVKIGIDAPMAIKVVRGELVESQPLDLGWMNGWRETPRIVKRCRELGHAISDVDSSGRGYHHVVKCEECNYVYHVDSSD